MVNLEDSILEILACPKCKGELEYKKDYFVCAKCELLYMVEDGIPNFLIEEAVKLDSKKMEEKLKNDTNN